MTTSELIAGLDAAAEGLADRMAEIDRAVDATIERYNRLGLHVAVEVETPAPPDSSARYSLIWAPMGYYQGVDNAGRRLSPPAPEGQPIWRHSSIGVRVTHGASKPDVRTWSRMSGIERTLALAALPELLARMAAAAAERSEEADAALEALASA